MTFGKLERVELRDFWGSEAYDFTLWLAQAENLETLSATLGMDLERVGTEQSVGPCRCISKGIRTCFIYSICSIWLLRC